MITFFKDENIIKINTKDTTYAMKIAYDKYVAHLYYGTKREDFKNLYKQKVVSFAPYSEETGYKFSLDTISTELSFFGSGDLRSTALKIKNSNGDSVTLFEFEKFNIYKGQPLMDEGLPYSRKGDETLELIYFDKVSKCRLFSYYTVFENTNTITRYIKIINEGEKPVEIQSIYPLQLDFCKGDFKMITLDGSYFNERNIEERPLSYGINGIYSKRGHSSHQFNPFVALKGKGATENKGNVYGFVFDYSGNFTIKVEKCYNEFTRVLVGMNDDTFSWKLEKNECFCSPECVITCSSSGFNGMTNNFHDHIRTSVLPERFALKERPVLINTWEAVHFNVNEDIVLNYAEKARLLGIDMIVIDDGWFGKRNNDKSSLGDWTVNDEKFSGGMASLSQKIREKGLKFGIWIEPEMISRRSKLYKEHPDWVLCCKDRQPSLGRNQLVLDLTNDEAVNYVANSIISVFKGCNPDYVKWDFNRSLTEVGSIYLPDDRQGEASHRFVIGCYKLHKKITSAFPDAIFEGCSGGGGRFDMGILHYCPQIWTSDNTDPVCRLEIQKGTSLVYPLSSMGAHISDSLFNKLESEIDYNFRLHVALSGVTGYEMDITKLTLKDEQIIRAQMEKIKEFQPLIVKGDLYRLDGLYKGEYAYVVASKDKGNFILSYTAISGRRHDKIYLSGINSNYSYVDEDGKVYKGSELVENGINTNAINDKKYTYFMKRFSRI